MIWWIDELMIWWFDEYIHIMDIQDTSTLLNFPIMNNELLNIKKRFHDSLEQVVQDHFVGNSSVQFTVVGSSIKISPGRLLLNMFFTDLYIILSCHIDKIWPNHFNLLALTPVTRSYVLFSCFVSSCGDRSVTGIMITILLFVLFSVRIVSSFRIQTSDPYVMTEHTTKNIVETKSF